MTLTTRTLSLLPILALALGLSTFASAQDTAGPPTREEAARTQPPATPVDREMLQNLLQEILAGQDQVQPLVDGVDVSAAQTWLDESALTRLQELAAQEGLSDAQRTVWQQAVEAEQAGTERIRGALSRADIALTAVTRLETTQGRIEAILAQFEPDESDPERTLSQIEQDISSLNTRRTQIGIELSQRRQTLGQLEEQLRTQAATLEQLSREEETDLAALAAQDNSASEASAEALAALTTAQERRIRARLIAAQLDGQGFPPRVARLRIEIDANAIEERWMTQRLAALQAEFNFRSTEELRGLNSGIQELVGREPQFAEQNSARISALRAFIDEMEQIQARIRELQQDREQYQRLEVDLSQTLANVEERLEIGGLTEILGSLFLEEQRRLQSLDDTRVTLQQIERELSSTRLRNITLRERLNLLEEPFDFTSGESAEEELQRLNFEILSALVIAADSLTEQLRQTEAQLRSLLAVVSTLDQILTETLLWWPSHRPVSLDLLKRLPEAIVAVLSVSSWREMRQALLDITWRSPTAFLLSLLFTLALVHVGRNARPHMKLLAEKARHRFTDSILNTLKALGWTLVRVAPVPIFLGISAWRLQQIAALSPNLELVANAMISAALWWLAAHFILLITSKDGIGLVHFDWKPFFILRLRRSLAWYGPLMFVLILVLAVVQTHPNELVFDLFGRAGLVAIGLFLGIFVWRVLSVKDVSTLSQNTDRTRRLVRLVMLLFSAAVVILALMGYLLTVTELLLRILDTLVVVGVVWVGYRLASRMLLLSEIKLRVRRAREERLKQAALESNVAAGEGVDIPEASLSVESINQQTRTLVRVTSGGVMVLALFWVWAEVLPALTWLDGIPLWSRSIVEGETEIISQVSLQDILLAVLLIALLTMASRNLPGLVEILLSRGTRMDAAGRYTATTLLRYFILVVVVISVFSLLGLRWSELQWMVAALTLGLGFGLQEVVANFVSGLIILFERPIRVGDAITIGEYSGIVGRIRTRATTIVDWDNREILVPNKTFITERLINWTLSDTVTRVTIRVGVSYESDVELVLKTLEEVANDDPLVLSEPAPQVFFLQFGDSTLNFELRVFVAQFRERMVVTSQIHRTIIKRFRELGIEIAFPQMDLHVRDMAPFQALAAKAAPGKTGAAEERGNAEDAADTPPPYT